jgi:adenosylcobinamide-phosphate synthase
MLFDWLIPDDPRLPLCGIVLLALAVDAVLGDPAWLYRRVPHPVVLIGRLVGWGDARLNRPDLGRAARIARGAALTAAVVALAAGLGWALAAVLRAVPLGWAVEALLAATLIAFRSLYHHVRAVADGLDGGLDAGRAAVGHIVGRDPLSLDEAGVARAAVESAAENFSDGVAAPLFWFVLLGLPGLVGYKAVNTLDSMIGHRTPRHEAFGKAAARLDDAANWLPARLAGLVFVAAAALLPGADAGRAWATMRRDARRHRSPNAGWPEAAMAGALNFALAGPRRYGDHMVNDPWLGTGRPTLTAPDIRQALRLYMMAGVVTAALLALCVIFQFATALAWTR